MVGFASLHPTLRNLREEQKAFFKRGLEQGKTAAELRGQAAQAGYRRDGGLGSGHDRLAVGGAENMLQEAFSDLGL